MTHETLKQTVKDAAKATREMGADALTTAKAEAKSAASSAAKSLRAEAEARAEEGKAQLSRQGMKLNEVLRNRAESADYAIERRVLNVVAGGVAEMSKDLRGRSVSSIVDETERFARRHPGAFIAGAAIAGFAIARFARASSRDAENPAPDYPVPAPAPSTAATPRAPVHRSEGGAIKDAAYETGTRQ